MRWLIVPLLAAAAPAAAQLQPAAPLATPSVPAPTLTVWNPAAPYITVGQDEPGYRRWYAGASWRPVYVRAFNDYLVQQGVAGVVPTWQLLRTATSWHRCGGEPFEVPPSSEWPRIVQTLRYIHAHVVPVIGPVEAVSGYRNPGLNVCAGGAPESAHKHYSAIDMVPLRPTTREDLIRRLCGVHARRGSEYGAGLGFYSFLRFHVDTTKFRRWGADLSSSSCPPIIRPEDVASVAQPLPQAQPVQAEPVQVQPVQAQPGQVQPAPAQSPPLRATPMQPARPLAPSATPPAAAPAGVPLAAISVPPEQPKP